MRMIKQLSKIGYIGSILMLVTLNNYFWFTIGRLGEWIDNGISLLFLYLIVMTYFTRSYDEQGYFERSYSLKLALGFAIPSSLLVVMSFMTGFDEIRFEHYFTVGLLLLTFNYVLATMIKDDL